MFHVLRVASDYSMVVVCETEKEVPDPEDLECRFYLYDTNGLKKQDFAETNYRSVLGYFSGHADGLGFGEIPAKPFASMEDVRTWHRLGRATSVVTEYEKLLADETLSQDLRERCEAGVTAARAELADMRARYAPT